MRHTAACLHADRAYGVCCPRADPPHNVSAVFFPSTNSWRTAFPDRAPSPHNNIINYILLSNNAVVSPDLVAACDNVSADFRRRRRRRVCYLFVFVGRVYPHRRIINFRPIKPNGRRAHLVFPVSPSRHPGHGLISSVHSYFGLKSSEISEYTSDKFRRR